MLLPPCTGIEAFSNWFRVLHRYELQASYIAAFLKYIVSACICVIGIYLMGGCIKIDKIQHLSWLEGLSTVVAIEIWFLQDIYWRKVVKQMDGARSGLFSMRKLARFVKCWGGALTVFKTTKLVQSSKHFCRHKFHWEHLCITNLNSLTLTLFALKQGCMRLHFQISGTVFFLSSLTWFRYMCRTWHVY